MTTYTVPVLEKTFKIISGILEHNDGMTLSEIVKKGEIPKTTVYKILYTLEKELILEKKGDKYFLGSMLIHYGLHTLSQRDLKVVANPFLIKLMEKTGETAHLAVLVGMQSMILDTVLSTHPIRFSSPVGSLFPLYCTSHGKIFLTYNENFTLENYYENNSFVKRTKNTLLDLDSLKKEIEIIRKQGYSMDEVEFAEDIRCCAAPIMDNTGLCIGAVGITSTVITFGPDRIEEISSEVKKTAIKISTEMGYRGFAK